MLRIIWKYPCPIHVINMTVGTTIVSGNFFFLIFLQITVNSYVV